MKQQKIKRMVGIALLMALVLVLQMLGGVLPSIGGFSLSLVLIPIVIGASVYGAGAGAFLGAVFGMIVYINCVTGADPGGAMVFQASPVLCFLVVMGKGTLAGLGAGLVYRVLSAHDRRLAILGAAITCPVINTGVFVASMLTVFPDVLRQWASGGDVLSYVLSGLILLNFVPELIINILFGMAGETVLHTVKNRGA